MKDQLNKIFHKVFHSEEQLDYFFAPGRVNLIGEHTDYNGGLVFPCALDVGTYIAMAKRNDDIIRLYSDNFPEKGIMEVALSDLANKEEDDWANYPKGVIKIMKDHGYEGKTGFDAVFYGNIPNGAGLSSSASIELVTAILWDWLHGFQIDRVEMVKMCQEVENKYIGVNSGIMDQFAIGMGKEDHAILLDCNTLDYEYAPIQLEGMKLVIANTNKRRTLADSKYNERRAECEQALKDLQSVVSINHLCDLSTEKFEEIKHAIKDPIALNRAKHAVTENERTKVAVEKLKEMDLDAFGQLMNQSHISLRDDYEVTGDHLDALVEAAWEETDVLGSRMTGAGFGGCTVSLVKEVDLDGIVERIGKRYEEKTGITPEFYIVGVGTGAKKV
ncbi:galactokinase [Evansella sp. AB-rgal1]|uniref:galactokinase n=1 Tax=Evansella sp. AB-rgal1 TaxID=3242696 RepID=UPI00359CFC26